jgi:hypothetical protein
MNDLDPSHLILLNPRTTLAQRSQANTMTNNIQTFNAFTLLDELGRNRNCALHDSVGKVWVG